MPPSPADASRAREKMLENYKKRTTLTEDQRDMADYQIQLERDLRETGILPEGSNRDARPYVAWMVVGLILVAAVLWAAWRGT